MKENVSNMQTHVIHLPVAGRAVYRVGFTESGIFGMLEVVREVKLRRERRLMRRWQKKIHRPMNGDPRPMKLVYVIAGKVVRVAIEKDDLGLIFGRPSV